MRYSLVTLALGAALFAFAGEASAQVDSKTANLWTVHTTQTGCKVVVSVGAMYGFTNPSRLTWSGSCARNGLAEGQGEMRVYFREEGADIYADYHGRFAGGLMQGDWKFASWEKNGDDWAGAGIYNYLAFQDGCMTRFEGTAVRSPCRVVNGRATAANAATVPAPATNSGGPDTRGTHGGPISLPSGKNR